MAMVGEHRVSKKSSSYRGVSRTSRNAWGVKYSGKRIKSTCRTEEEAARLYDDYLRTVHPEKYLKLANFCPYCSSDRIKHPPCSCMGSPVQKHHPGFDPAVNREQQDSRVHHQNFKPTGNMYQSERPVSFAHCQNTEPPCKVEAFENEDIEMHDGGPRCSLTEQMFSDHSTDHEQSRKRCHSDSAVQSEGCIHHNMPVRGPLSEDYSCSHNTTSFGAPAAYSPFEEMQPSMEDNSNHSNSKKMWCDPDLNAARGLLLMKGVNVDSWTLQGLFRSETSSRPFGWAAPP